MREAWGCIMRNLSFAEAAMESRKEIVERFESSVCKFADIPVNLTIELSFGSENVIAIHRFVKKKGTIR